MVTINFTLNNFSELPILLDVFGSFDNNYEYTAGGIFRRKTSPFCPESDIPQMYTDVKSICRFAHYSSL